MPTLKASVIIPTCNRAHILSHCLNYLVHQTTKDYEIIVIDDASQDATPQLNAKLKSQISNLKYIRLNIRVGPYEARNIGIKEAKGEVIIFLDSDVIVHKRFVQDHIQIHERNKNIYVQGMVKHIRSMGQVDFRFYYPNALCIGTFITQNVSVRKEWIDRIGGFESFGSKMGYKDVDMGLRLRQIGIRGVHAILSCKAYHIDGNPANTNLQDYFLKHQERGRNAVFFLEKKKKKGERSSK
ncbi:MAG: glycosyltransferase family 2 protein [Candidatus Stahlbacteria bacterium]|nr:glycosyltransferase family 2 protein [Candidatus Stahlbacteria bacterium]